MKTKKLIYALLFAIALTGCNKDDDNSEKIPSSNIPDENFLKYLLDNFDTNKDGILSIEESSIIKEIKCSDNNSINSLKGIEYFPNLEKLTLNTLYGIDSIDLSNNAGLKELYIFETGIRMLDISHNPDLEILDCNNNHSLNSLITGSNTFLKQLNCSNTIITSVNTDSFKSLKMLNIESTKIDTINTKENRALKELYCSGTKQQSNRIKKLDLANNPDLRILDCNFNEIEELDLSNNSLLEILHCKNNNLSKINVSQNTELKDIDISNNDIAFLNISQNTRLKKLFCSETKISSLDIRNTIIDSLSCSSNYLTTLNAHGSQTLKMLECSSYAESIDASTSTIETIKYDQRISPQDLYSQEEVSLLLNNCPNLKEVTFKQVITYPRGTEEIFNYGKITMDVSNCKSLQNFSANFLSKLKIDNCPELKNLTCIGSIKELDLSGNTGLEKLYCYSNKLESININACTSLKDLYCLGVIEKLDLSKNQDIEKMTLITGNLSSLNIDALSKLKYMDLGMYYTNSTLNIDKNRALEEIIIRDSIYNNKDEVMEKSLKLNIADLPLLKYVLNKSDILTEVRISNCQKIEQISFKNANSSYPYREKSLSYLDIKNCPSLQNVYANKHKLTHVDISDCANLDTIEIAANNLTSIKLDKSVQYLDCSENQLASLDLGGYTHLKNLYCYSNQINNLNTDECGNIEVFDCSDNNLSTLSTNKLLKLTELYCNKNQLLTLDISKNLSLNKVDCTENKSLNKLTVNNKQTFTSLKKDSSTEIIYVD